MQHRARTFIRDPHRIGKNLRLLQASCIRTSCPCQLVDSDRSLPIKRQAQLRPLHEIGCRAAGHHRIWLPSKLPPEVRSFFRNHKRPRVRRSVFHMSVPVSWNCSFPANPPRQTDCPFPLRPVLRSPDAPDFTHAPPGIRPPALLIALPSQQSPMLPFYVDSPFPI